MKNNIRSRRIRPVEIKIGLLFLVVLAMLTGCIGTKEDEKPDGSAFHLYYISGDETSLVEEAYEPADENSRAMLKELLKFLKSEPATAGVEALLPQEVEVKSHSITDNTLTLDFNEAYKEMSSTREVLARAGIVKLFAQIPNIEYVKIYVEGEELKDSKGNSLSIMNGDTFLEYSGENLNSYQYAVINLYFTDQEGTALIPEEREVYYNSNVPLEQVVVEQLMKGPQQEGLYPTLPSNLTIMGVTRDGTNCYVNLDNTFISGAIATEESMIPVYSIVDSLAEDCQVEKVQISVNGETNVEFRDDIMLDGFFEKNTDLIRLQEESDQS